jgi:hypothetical protein
LSLSRKFETSGRRREEQALRRLPVKSSGDLESILNKFRNFEFRINFEIQKAMEHIIMLDSARGSLLYQKDLLFQEIIYRWRMLHFFVVGWVWFRVLVQ